MSSSRLFFSYFYFAPTPCKDANTTILEPCEIISNLSSEVREAWENAAHKEFFAGYEVGDEPHCFEEHIDIKTLQACINLGTGLGYTLYPATPTDKDDYPEDLLLNAETDS